MDRGTGRHDITEILLKTALKTIQSTNQSIPSSGNFFPETDVTFLLVIVLGFILKAMTYHYFTDDYVGKQPKA